MLRPFAHPVACCWKWWCVVEQCLKLVKLFSHQLLTFLLFRDLRSVAQQCWIRLQSSSNIFRATRSHYGLYRSQDALQLPTSLGVVSSVCTAPPQQQLPTLLAQQCSELLRSFARTSRPTLGP